MDPRIRLWNTLDWSLNSEIDGHANAVTRAIPTPNQQRLISTSSDRTTRICTFPAGAPIHIFSDHKNTVSDADISSDGSLLATGSYDSRILLYNLADYRLLATLKGHPKNISGVRFVPHTNLLASSGLGTDVVIWSIPDGKLLHRLPGHDTVSQIIGWGPTSHHLRTIDYAGILRQWNVTTGALILDATLDLPQPSASAISPDGAVLAVTAPHTLALFRTSDWERLDTLTFKTKGIYGVTWSPNGDQLAIAAADGKLRIWQTADVTWSHELATT
jgi:WD40 repeat protein